VVDVARAVESAGDGYGSPRPESENPTGLGNPFSAQAADGYGSPVAADPLQTSNDGLAAGESYGAPPLPVTPLDDFNTLVLPRAQEPSDSYGSPEPVSGNDVAPDVTGDDQSPPSYNPQSFPESAEENSSADGYNSPASEEAADGYGGPDVGPATEGADFPEDESVEDASTSDEETNGFLPDPDSNDLQDVRYAGKQFDEPLYRDATPLKDSYNAKGQEQDLQHDSSDVRLEVTPPDGSGTENKDEAETDEAPHVHVSEGPAAATRFDLPSSDPLNVDPSPSRPSGAPRRPPRSHPRLKPLVVEDI